MKKSIFQIHHLDAWVKTMASFFEKLNPRRWWLWRKHRKAIEGEARKLLPRPYDLGAILIEARTGKVIPSPREGTVYLAGNQQSRKPSESRAPRDSDKLIAGGEALALYGVGVAEKMLAIDSHVYETMSNLSRTQIDNLSDLSARFQNWDHSSWSGLSEGALNKFSGHVGEVYAAEHLNDIGVAIQWPEASNQAGWDLLVAGHEVNVKTIADAADLHAHFARYPDIAALIPGDAQNIPAGAFHLTPGGSAAALDNYLATHDHHAVIVDQSLSHADVVHHAADASDAALGSASVADMHLPWITLATSGWREIKLLNNAQTDVVAAAKNLSLDVAGRGGGAAVGAKGGALLGGLLGPIGAAVGAVIGGIGGAIVGGDVASSIKRKPLDAAVAGYKSAETALKTKSLQINADAKNRYRTTRAAEQTALRDAAHTQQGSLNGEYQRLLKWRHELENVPKEGAEKLLAITKEQLEAQHRRLLEDLAGVGFFDRRIWPSPLTLSIEHAIAELERVIALVITMQAKPADLSQSALFALLARYGLAEDVVRDVAKFTETQRRSMENSFTQKIAKAEMLLAEYRVQAFKRLALSVAKIVANVQQEIRPYVEQATVASKEVRIEMNKLGMR
jgi:hypothetical protein